MSKGTMTSRIEEYKSLPFSKALYYLVQHKARCNRECWAEEGYRWIELHTPSNRSTMSLPYIYIKTSCGEKVPWVPSTLDILANDWEASVLQWEYV